MASSLDPDSFELGDYLGILRRRWWVVLLTASLAILLAAAYVRLAPRTYTATTTVFVSANAANSVQAVGGRTAGVVVNMDNEAQIAQSDSVAAPAAKALHSKLPLSQIVKQVSVTVPANTTVLEISCSAPSPRGAAACAQAVATSYLTVRAEQAQGKIGFEVTQLQNREAPLVAKSLSLRKQQRGLSRTSPKRAEIGAQIKNVESQIATLRSDISALGGSVNYNPGNILTAATTPSAPSSPQPLLDLPSGLVAGLLIGLVLAFVIDRRDDRTHSAREVERFLHLPILLSLNQNRLDEVTSLASPRSETGRAFTELSEAVGAGLGDGNHVVAVVASSRGQAGSIVAANLAAALARTRADVLLVCASPQNTIMGRLLGIGGRRGQAGLADVMAGTATLGEAARRVAEVARLRVLAVGGPTTALVDHLDYDANENLMKDLRRLARYVVIEVPAAGEAVDTFALAEFADAAIVVVETSRTRKADTARCVARLDRMRTVILGSAVLPPTRRPGKDVPAPERFPERGLPGAATSVTRKPARDKPPEPREVAASSAMPGSMDDD
jgi:capsular polysaccharide biosynthesis protein/MinD-like ATPase involved in chromosome partitioning or flagellar assembly